MWLKYTNMRITVLFLGFVVVVLASAMAAPAEPENSDLKERNGELRPFAEEGQSGGTSEKGKKIREKVEKAKEKVGKAKEKVKGLSDKAKKKAKDAVKDIKD